MKIKVKVKKSFIDRDSRVRHVPGEELEITEKRYKEILSVGDFVEKITPTTAADPETTSEETKAAVDTEKEKVAPVQPRRRAKKNGN